MSLDAVHPFDVPVAVLICICREDRIDWVESAVNSIIGQDYADGPVRIYLGVDGPLSSAQDDWLLRSNALFYKIVRNVDNLGLSITLNRLIRVLGDELFVFRMDADDLSLPFRFREQINFLYNHPEVDIVGGAIWEFDDNAPVARKKIYPCRHAAISRYIMKANPLAHSTICFRRSFFTKIAFYPETSRYNQDLALWFEALHQGVKMANLQRPILCLRTSGAFYARRGYARAVSELRYYLVGTYRLQGLTWHMIFPLLRFISRLFPTPLARWLYRSQVRGWLSLGEN